MKRVLLVLAALAALAAVIVVARVLRSPASSEATGGEGFEPSESAQVVDVREIEWQPTADLVGTVVAMRSVVVRNELAGVVRQVGFQSGEIVEEGQVLLQQDDTTDRADLEAAKASVRVAEANVVQADSEIGLAESELGRLSEVQSRAIAEVDIDRARSRLDVARAAHVRWLAEVDQAKARQAQVEARLGKLTIRAPFRARAGMRTVHEGQYLAEGVDVVSIQEVTDRIYLDFAVPQEYAPRVVPGTSVMATADILGADQIRIEVVAVDATVNNQTRNLRVRAVVDNPGGVLYPGMFVQVRVPIDSPSTHVVVPSTAIRRAAYGDSVFRVKKDESGAARAEQRFVKLGPTIGEEVIVTEGLLAGDRVAAAGSFKLFDGMKLLEAAPEETSPSTASAETVSVDEARNGIASGKTE